jgi:hypothetical protein
MCENINYKAKHVLEEPTIEKFHDGSATHLEAIKWIRNFDLYKSSVSFRCIYGGKNE